MQCVKWIPINSHFSCYCCCFYFWMHQHQIKNHIEKVLLQNIFILPFVVVKDMMWTVNCVLFFCDSICRSFDAPDSFICIRNRNHIWAKPVWKIIFETAGKSKLSLVWMLCLCMFFSYICVCVVYTYVFNGQKDHSPFELVRVYFSQEWHKFILLLSVISYE